MAESVVYADLKFAVALPPTAPTCPTATDEDDSPYENVPLGTVAPAPNTGDTLAMATTSGLPWHRRMAGLAVGPWGDTQGCSSLAGSWPRRWRVPAGLLAASLLLLLVATMALGVCYWQVTRRLQDTSREHTAEQGRLSQEVSAREQSLEQTRLELAWARAELQRAWWEGNGSQLALESLNAELRRVKGALGQMEKEMKEVQGKLNNSESTVSSLRACVNTDCCPSGWVLYRSKCLFISSEMKRWQDSQDYCTRKSAQLLVLGDWSEWTLPVLSRAAAAFPEGG
ncbi:CD72 protein, partial [Alopecoenas beccarii]|nr:CD72 protein [Alopecoenas beccarii]